MPRPVFSQLVQIVVIHTWIVLLATPASARQQRDASPPKVDPAAMGRLVEAFGDRLRESYAFPENADAVIAHARGLVDSGAYDDVTNGYAFASRLTDDLRAFAKDRHFGVQYDPDRYQAIAAMGLGPNPNLGRLSDDDEGPAMPGPGDPGYDALMQRFVPTNFGMTRLEVLEGNVGYLQLGIFPPIDLARPTLDAAMTFLGNVEALIIDVRDVPGGVGGFTPYLSSYFFEEHDKLLFSRVFPWAGDSDEFRVTSDVGAPKRPDLPLWILVNDRTGSAAENLAYTLQQHGRATVVGDTTVGAANSSSLVQLVDGYVAQIPIARVIHPVSGGNWEGTGVRPDVISPSDEALDVAHSKALEALGKPPVESAPITTDDPVNLEDYVGSYGVRRIFVENGRLMFQRAGGPSVPLVRKGEDLFRFDLSPNMRPATPLPDLLFDRDENGQVYQVTALESDGSVREVTPRDG